MSPFTIKPVSRPRGVYLILEVLERGLVIASAFKEGGEKKFFTLDNIELEISNITMEDIH